MKRMVVSTVPVLATALAAQTPQDGRPLPSGAYLVRLSGPGVLGSRRITLVR